MRTGADSDIAIALRRANRALAALNACHRANTRAGDEQSLLQEVCEALIEVGGYRMAWVGMPENTAGKRVRPVAVAGHASGYLEAITVLWDETPLGRGPVGTAVRTGQPSVVQDIRIDVATDPWRDEIVSRGYAAFIALPLIVDGHVHAVLAVYASEPDAFDPHETQLLAQLADAVGFGITTLRAHLGRQRAEAALRASEEQYRRIVETANEGIWQFDADVNTTFVNRRMAEMTGYSVDEMVGTPLLGFLEDGSRAAMGRELAVIRENVVQRRSPTSGSDGVPKLDESASAIALAPAASGTSGLDGWGQLELVICRKDGSDLWAHFAISAIVDCDGALTSGMAMVTDITQRKQEEYALQQARAMADQLARLRQDQIEEAQALAAVSTALASTLDLSQLYDVILEQSARVLTCDHACILRYEDGWAVVAASWGVQRQAVGTRVFPVAAIEPVAAYGSEGKPALIRDTEAIKWIDVPPFLDQYRIRSELAVPLQLDQAIVGTFNVDSFTPNFYTARHLSLAVVLGERVTQALRNARLYASEQARARTAEELAQIRQEQAEEAEVLAQVSTALTSTFEPAQLYERILDQISRIVPCDHAVVLVVEDGWAVVAATWGAVTLPIGTRAFSLAGASPEVAAKFRAGRPTLIQDTAALIDWTGGPPFVGDRATRSVLTVPLLVEGKLAAMLEVQHRAPNSFTHRHLALAVTIGERVAQAILNTRLFQAEQQRARAAEALVQAREEFVAAVSHELRTPLTSIIGYGEMLQARWRQLDDAQRLDRIGRIVLSANRQRRLVEDLLLLTRLDGGLTSTRVVPVTVASLVERAADEIRASYRSQVIDLKGPKELLADADPDRTVQIVANLFDNAAKYSIEGSSILATWQQEDALVVVRVHDSGSGIAEDDRHRLFTRFGRIPGSRIRSGRVGTGLGLYLGRQLARSMDGDLDLERSSPNGSVFRLLLRASAADR